METIELHIGMKVFYHNPKQPDVTYLQTYRVMKLPWPAPTSISLVTIASEYWQGRVNKKNLEPAPECGCTYCDMQAMIASNQKDDFPTHQLIEDLIVTALEGGSNYWYYLNDDAAEVYDEFDGDGMISIQVTMAVLAGKRIPVRDVEDNTLLGYLSLEGISSALDVMKEKYIDSYQAIADEDFDAGDADILFQIAVMGEIVYC